MDDRADLLRAALRYCVYAIRDLRDRGFSGQPYGFYLKDPFQDPAYRESYVRQIILYDIQTAVASLAVDVFPSTSALRSHLVELGRTAPFDPQTLEHTEIDERSIADERNRFCAYVQGLTEEDLRNVGPVPTKRDLTPRERDRIWTRLYKRWGVERNAVWYPLTGTPPPPNVLALEHDWFAWDVPLATLRAILASRRVRHVWEIWNTPQWHASELDLALFIPDGYEAFYTSEKMDWMLYASHESSLTICGDWLLNLVKQTWSAWAEHLYRGYEYPRPPYGERSGESPAGG